jgi:hypothetical protein
MHKTRTFRKNPSQSGISQTIASDVPWCKSQNGRPKKTILHQSIKTPSGQILGLVKANLLR